MRRLFLITRWTCLCTLTLLSRQASAQSAPAGDAPRGIPIAYTLAKAGRISLAVYDAHGRQIRTLRNAEQQAAGAQTVMWDGLDKAGKPAVPGAYSWKLLNSQGMKAEYLMSVGTSFREKHWPGQHGGPGAVAAGDGAVYMASAGSEGSPDMAKVSFDGKWQWAVGGGSPSDMAVWGKRLYRQTSDGKRGVVQVNDVETTAGVGSFGVDLGKDKDDKPNVAERLDVREGVLVCASLNGAIAWLDSATGKSLETSNIAGGLKDIALASNDTVYAVQGDKMVSLKRGETAVVERITGLRSPRRLTVDSSTGDIFIFDGGPQQIKRYDKSFKLIKTLGRAGGRQQGLYEPEDFMEIVGLSADGAGGFVITEWFSAPRRTAHFDANGKLRNEWYGGQQFYTFPAIDPANPNLVWIDSQWGSVMQCEVDYEKRTWKVRATYGWAWNVPESLVGRGKMATPHYVIHRDGDKDGVPETYLYAGSVNGFLQKVDEKARTLRPVAVSSFAVPGDRWDGMRPPVEQMPPMWVAAIRKLGVEPVNTQIRERYRRFTWTDLNDDINFQPEEFRLSADATYGSGTLWMDSELNNYYSEDRGSAGPAWTRFDVQGYTPSGNPIWDLTKQTRGPKSPYSGTNALTGDAAGNMYTVQSNGTGDGFIGAGTGGQGHAFGWPANWLDSSGVVKYDKNNQVMWESGFHAARSNNPPGQLQCPVRIAGVVNGTIGVCDKVIQPLVFWTDDGLYAGALFDRRADDGLPVRIYRWWTGGTDDFHPVTGRSPLQYDMLEGGSLTKLANGDVLFYGAGWNNCPVYKVTGWDEFERQEGKLQVAAPAKAAAAKGTGLLTQYFESGEVTGAPLVLGPDYEKASTITPRLWIDPKHPLASTAPGNAPPDPDQILAEERRAGSVRWSGAVEAKFSGGTVLGVYGNNFRLAVGGKVVIDAWKISNNAHVFTAPIAAEAGEKIPIVLEHRLPGLKPDIHLVWEGVSQQIEHIPTAFLYPQP